jgi:3-methylfumaryl-CoA hydratase
MAAQTVDIAHLRQWIGRTETVRDLITPRLVAGLRATLDQEPGDPKNGDVAPLAVHWCLAPPTVTSSQTGPDGHPKRGGFLPPVPLPRRMWAGGELMLHDSLRVGDDVERRSRIANVELKQGSTGQLCFVTLEHEIVSPRGSAINERQDVVYREAPPPDAQKSTPPAPTGAPTPTWRREVRADELTLFRYSALTFNGHRIHYDRRYCIEEEGYPGLIVHGPLQATFLAEFAASIRGRTPSAFTFRGVNPMFDDDGCTVNAIESGNDLELWTANRHGTQTMKARASWR